MASWLILKTPGVGFGTDVSKISGIPFISSDNLTPPSLASTARQGVATGCGASSARGLGTWVGSKAGYEEKGGDYFAPEIHLTGT